MAKFYKYDEKGEGRVEEKPTDERNKMSTVNKWWQQIKLH